MNDHHSLDHPVDSTYDHVLGSEQAEVVLLEYGSYACPHCRAANNVIYALRNHFGTRLLYAFRHHPLPNNELAWRAAELVERVPPDHFWEAHVALMTRSQTLTEADLVAVATEFGVGDSSPDADDAQARAKARVETDEASSAASGVWLTPTFFVNGRRYGGAWDNAELTDALEGSLGHRLRVRALQFASWAPAAGVLLVLAAVLAVLITNSPLGPDLAALLAVPFGLTLGEQHYALPLVSWINDGLLTLFFLVVGLEIKREFTVGHLSSPRSAALPIAAALGGNIMPAVLYLLLIPAGQWAHGWGVPIATDTAFAIALIALLGRRVPSELRIFLTAATIVDDIVAILVVAVFYSPGQQWGWLLAALGVLAALALLNKTHVYYVTPYLVLGIVLWVCIHAGGLHATLTGVLLALFIPTRPPPDYRALMGQADAILASEARHGKEALRRGPSEPAMQALDRIHDRLESPANRMLRVAGARANYVVLPLFAFANAGVVLESGVFAGHGPLILAIVIALVLGKPAGMFLFSLVAVRLRLATKPDAYSWPQVLGAGALSGIGFTMSLLIAQQAFTEPADFAAAKIAVFVGSILAAVIGTALLWRARRDTK